MKFKLKKFSSLLIIIYAIFFLTPAVQASCLWVEQTTWYNNTTKKNETSGGCSDVQNQSADNLCSGTKPVYEQVYGTAKVSVCCCDKVTNPQVASKEVCSWEKQTISQNGSTDCSSGKSIFSDDNCSGTKPTYANTSIYSYEKAICCCKSNTIPVNTKAEQSTLFEAPDIKITIPGMEQLSDINCAPGDTCEIPWLGQYIRGIYNYAIAIAGILAAVVLMGGGLLWLVSRGDASQVTKAKELIFGSITGMIILTGSYLILTLINPSLVNLQNIQIASIKTKDLEPLSYDGNPNGDKTCLNCTEFSKIPVKNGNLANADLVKKLENAWDISNKNWRITEAFPWTSEHQSKCHYNGTCVDVALTSNQICTEVHKLIENLKNSGLSVLNEYPDCQGVTTKNTTGGHLHVR